MFAPKTLFWIVLPGLLLALLLGGWFMVGTVPLWLMAAVVVQLLWLAFGQVRRMRIALTGDSLQAGESSEQRKSLAADWSYWLRQLFVFGLILVLALLGQALWLMSKYELPFDLAWQRPLQQIKVLPVPLPEMVTIPAGEFQMGSETGENDEKPVHSVTIDYSFEIGKYELTFAEFDHFVVAMREAGIAFKDGADAEAVTPYPFSKDEGWGRGNRPVINVSWYQAQDYVNWLSRKIGLQCRLPSEAEWEYAAGAGEDADYFWGDEIGVNNANCRDCGSQWDGKQTAPVGSFAANKFGLLDMHGNVSEWVQDLYHGNYEDAPADGSSREFGKGALRILRGGSWGGTPDFLRSSGRLWYAPDLRHFDIGFRFICPH